MFTGIITDIGTLLERRDGRFEIGCRYPVSSIAIGASIACDGCCLTVTERAPADTGAKFSVDVSNETLARTTLGQWQVGDAINLEASLKAGDELGGHVVTGHVDATAEIVSVAPDGDSQRMTFKVPQKLGQFIAEKGSVAVDGTSLTVNAVTSDTFTVNVIPHTLTHTTLGRKKIEDRSNIEVDLFARYVARMMEFRCDTV